MRKSFFLVGLIAIVSIIWFAWHEVHQTRVVGTRPPDMDGRITRLERDANGIKMYVEDTGGKDKGSLAIVRVLDNTRIFVKKGDDYIFLDKDQYMNEMSVGTSILLFFNGAVQMSFPQTGNARKIILLKD